MIEVVFDVETDGLLNEATKVHLICLCDTSNAEREVRVYHDQSALASDGPLADGLAALRRANVLVGHNIQGFDLPVLRKLTGFETDAAVRDTLILSRVLWSDIARLDGRALRGKGRLHGSHALKAWGERFRFPKGDHSDFSRLSQDMIDYCVRDVRLTDLLWQRIQSKDLDPTASDLEHEFSAIIDAQMRSGFLLDNIRVDELVRKLTVRRAELDVQLQVAFPPKQVEYITPKKRLVRQRTEVFNPESRQQVAARLIERGWEPSEFTPNGQPTVNEDVLEQLTDPDVALLTERMMVQRRLGSVTEGTKAWLKFQGADGRVHGYVNHCGTNTHRVTHSRPNMSQVTSVDKPWGQESRSCWVAGPGMKLVGADASGIEARWFAHLLVPHDGGRFRDMILGGQDVHEANAAILGLPRNKAKNWFYAFMYGAGPKKLGEMAGVSETCGHRMRQNFLNRFAGLGALLQDLEIVLLDRNMAVRTRLRSGNWSLRLRDNAHFRAVDGRPLPVRSLHSALNTVIQGNAAVMMKQAAVLSHHTMESEGLMLGQDYHQVGYFHDEMQWEVPVPHAEFAGQCMVRGIEAAGTFFRTRCPMTGEFHVGDDWSQTH